MRKVRQSRKEETQLARGVVLHKSRFIKLKSGVHGVEIIFLICLGDVAFVVCGHLAAKNRIEREHEIPRRHQQDTITATRNEKHQ